MQTETKTIEQWAIRLIWEFQRALPNIKLCVEAMIELLSQELDELMNSEKLKVKEGQWCMRASYVIKQHTPEAPDNQVTMLAALAATMLRVYLSSRTEVDADMIRNINESLEIRVGKEAADDMACRVSKAFRLAGCEQVKVEIAEAIDASGETGHVDLTLRSHVGGTPVAVAVEAELPAESILQGENESRKEIVLKGETDTQDDVVLQREADSQNSVVLKDGGCRIEQVAELNTPDARELLDFFVAKGFLDSNYQPVGMTCVQKAYLADALGKHLFIRNRWKCFGELWGFSNIRTFGRYLDKALHQANMGDFISLVTKILNDCPV